MDRQLSPVSPTITLPPTEFPYPHSDQNSSRDVHLDSDTTLHDTDQSSAVKPSVENVTGRQEPNRPSIASSKFATELSKPVGKRSPVPTLQRHASDTPNSQEINADGNTLSDSADSSDEWSSDNSHERQLEKEKSAAEYQKISARHLNQISRHPRRPGSRRNSSNRFSFGNDDFRTRGKISRMDGRLKISVNETANTGYLAKALGTTLHHHLKPQDEHEEEAKRVQTRQEEEPGSPVRIPRLNIVIMVIGSRGDIQPFLKIGKVLKDKYNHRVRIATHPTFRTFVEKEVGLEFFSVGGDPSELMAFMVKNPGLIPSMDTVKAGEIGKRRESMYEMFQGFWRACINTTDNERDHSNARMMAGKSPFIADAIIANPPSFAHYHCAEKLGIPLHLVFTFPYSPTQAFPHPLANIKAGNVDQAYTNYMSYPLVELVTWQGLGDLVNRFRTKILGLEPVSTLWAPGQLSRLKVPTTYLWSPSLVPKPQDWGPEIDIAGYVFLDLASSFKPDDALDKVLKNGDSPLVYIGFGSISGIDDPAAFTRLIFDAVRMTGVRAVISKGWGGMGDGMDVPENVILVGNVPHDWLFPKVDAVIHHGGAGTTAIGLKCGKPTMIVPFFGDQPVWSAMVAKAGAGAKESIGLKKLTVENFAEGIRQCLSPEAKEKARGLAESIAAEGDGAERAVESFHRSLPLEGKHSMRCCIFEDRVAVWHVKHTSIQLSALAAHILVGTGRLSWHDVVLQRNSGWHDFQGPGEPITGAGGAFVSSLAEAFAGFSEIPKNAKKEMRRQEKKKRKKQKSTVASAVTLPGKIAQSREMNRAAQNGIEQGSPEELEAVNRDGEADPVKANRLKLTRTRSHSATRTNGSARPPMPSRATTTMSGGSINPDAKTAAKSTAKGTLQGLGHAAKAVATMPIDVSNALALGFRNAPRLYGDSTVRPPPHTITGFRSGLKAASSELCLGFYDGVVGLFKLPYRDTKEEGAVGVATGLGKGVGGVVLKPLSGMIGLGAYAGKGIEASIHKRFHDTAKTERWIRRARMAQGFKDANELANRSKALVEGQQRATDGLQEVQTHALTHWSSHEQHQLLEARQKERRGTAQPLLRRFGKGGKPDEGKDYHRNCGERSSSTSH